MTSVSANDTGPACPGQTPVPGWGRGAGHGVRRWNAARARTGSSSNQSPCSTSNPFGNGALTSMPSDRITLQRPHHSVVAVIGSGNDPGQRHQQRAAGLLQRRLAPQRLTVGEYAVSKSIQTLQRLFHQRRIQSDTVQYISEGLQATMPPEAPASMIPTSTGCIRVASHPATGLFGTIRLPILPRSAGRI
jgi:hypothetical protein